MLAKRRRWESNPLEPDQRCASVPAVGRLAIWLQRQVVSVLARSRAWSSTFARSRANPPHSEDESPFSALPRNRTSSSSSEDCRALRHTRRASVPTRTRTRKTSVETRYVVHCTPGRKWKAWDLNPHPREGNGLADRLGKPYPTTFRNAVGPRGDSNSQCRCGHDVLTVACLPIPPHGHLA